VLVAGGLLLMSAEGRGERAVRRDRAGAAYAAAEEAARTGDYARAAQLFELADSLLPSPQAIRSAARSRMAAGHNLVALSLSEAMLRRYSGDPKSRELAKEIIGVLGPRYTRLEIKCEQTCSLQVNGDRALTAQSLIHVVYLHPGRHILRAHFPSAASRPRVVRGSAGQVRRLRFAHPVPATPAPSSAAQSGEHTPVRAARSGGNGGRSGPVLPLLMGGVVTAGLGAASLLALNNWREAAASFAADPSPDNRSRRGREARDSRGLLAATAVSALLTATVAAVRGRGRVERERPGVSVAPHDDGVGIVLSGEWQ
jgi:hypothetical protein